MARDVKIEVICEERFKLKSEQAPLSEHSAMLFDAVAEVAHQHVGFAYNCLSEKRTHLSSADVKDVSEAGYV